MSPHDGEDARYSFHVTKISRPKLHAGHEAGEKQKYCVCVSDTNGQEQQRLVLDVSLNQSSRRTATRVNALTLRKFHRLHLVFEGDM